MTLVRRWSACLVLGAAGWSGLACNSSPAEDSIATARQPIELHDLNDTFGLAFIPPQPLAAGENFAALRDRLERQSFPVQATGSVHIPLRDDTGTPVTKYGSPVRFTCGATLISPSRVITAAHCVAATDVPGDATVVLEMYRPAQRLADEAVWRPRTVLTGTFPDYQRAPFTEADGYHVDHFTCRVESRCGTRFGDFNCPSAALTNGDVALLQCDNRPGDRYGYLDVAVNELPGVEVFVPWKHEVYDIPATEPTTSDRYQHYVLYPPSGQYWENYHYLGGEKNQLLPLMTQPWPDGTPRRKVSESTGLSISTDVLACHGTSGSGFLQREAAGVWQLLGPAATGGGNLAGFLCHHNPGVVGQGIAVVGQGTVAYSALIQTQMIVAPVDAALGSECLVPRAGLFVLPSRTRCEREHVGQTFVSRDLYSDFDPWRSPALHLAAGAASLGKIEIAAGQMYRVAVRAVTKGTCVEQAGGVRTCPELKLSVGGQGVLRGAFESSGVVRSQGTVFAAGATGALPITLEAQGGSFEVGEVTVVAEDRVNSFDRDIDRAQVAIVVPNIAAGNPVPARFVGDGRQGFAALIHPGERLLLTREAVALHGAFEVQFLAPANTELRCGLVGETGVVLVEKPCFAAIPNRFDVVVGARPAAVFVEISSGADPVEIDDVSVRYQATPLDPSCADRIRNGSESDIDCGGGTCAACGDGRNCVQPSDCLSSLCQGSVCRAIPSCSDGTKNGSETDVDCGGTCATDCGNGKSCTVGGDCVSGLCQSNLCVAAPRCDDGTKNGSETDVDCGGTCSKHCENGQSCQSDPDCQSGSCPNKVCAAPMSQVQATILISSSWNNGYCANVVVTNRSSTAINGWSVVYDMTQSTLSNGWSAQFSNSGSRYTARSLPWNARLAPAQTTSFGFCASSTGSGARATVVSASSP